MRIRDKAYVADLIEKFEIVKDIEQSRVTRGLGEWSAKFGCADVNRKRNRYSNVFPWDKNRVKLPVKQGSDYINASYINLGNRKYIAAQGPMHRTIYHFWAMCFNEAHKRQESDIIIIMLTPLVETDLIKCSCYWTKGKDDTFNLATFHKMFDNETIDLSPLALEFVSQTKYSVYTLTTMRLILGNVTKNVHHYYYHNWHDSQEPNHPPSLIGLLVQMKQAMARYKVEVPIIHCSAGVGRTGTFIAMDYLYHNPELLKERDIIYKILQLLRNDRVLMIQTFAQFWFLYNFFTRIEKFT